MNNGNNVTGGAASILAERNVAADFVNKSTLVTDTEGFELLRVASSLKLNQIEAQEMRARFIALLPLATDTQFEAVRVAALSEAELPEGFKVNGDFKLSNEQKEMLADAKADRIAALGQQRGQILADLLADEGQRLVSMKVRIGLKKTRSVLTFDKVTGAAKGGLLADLTARLKGV